MIGKLDVMFGAIVSSIKIVRESREFSCHGINLLYKGAYFGFFAQLTDS